MRGRWDVVRLSMAGGILAAVFMLLHTLSLAFGGMVTGLAFWGRIAAAAVVAAAIVAALVSLRNLVVARHRRGGAASGTKLGP